MDPTGQPTNQPIIDNSKFPLTTQQGLSPKDQAMIDSINLDELREAVEHGKILSDKQQARLKELEAKDTIRKASSGNADKPQA
jgi:hypothetical protein